MDDTWCTIESDPGVFTELIRNVGVEGVQVEEVYSLDDASFAHLHPVYGLVFLFKWTGESDDRQTVGPDCHPELFFAQQVIPNACATQAILNILLNSTDQVEVGEALADFKTFTAGFSPDMKGLAIGNSETIRSVHNGFSRQEPFFSDDKDDRRENEDSFHFVAYVPHDGKVFELDGLRPGPIVLGDCPSRSDSRGNEGAWLEVASPAIEERIGRYSSGEIRFNLMAIVKNRKQVAMEGKEQCERRIVVIDQALADESDAMRWISNDASFLRAQGMDNLLSQKTRELQASESFDSTIADEEAKATLRRNENARRKHNYVPFAITILTMIANKGAMHALVKSAASKTDVPSSQMGE